MMKMKTASKKRMVSILALIAILITFLSAPLLARAADSLTGKLSITYSESTGKITAVYDGDCTLSGAEVYTWYKDGSTIATGSSYAPSAAGTYYCILRDTNSYEGSLTSTSITLFRATGASVNFDNTYGLYEAGDTVTVSAVLNDGQTVTNWKTSATGVEIPQTGSSVTFRMPAQNVTVTATIKSLYTVKVYGGSADSYEGYSGDTITITASEVSGKEFVSWSATGGRLGDASQKTTTLTLASSNVVVTANFKGTVSTATTTNDSSSSYNGKADAKHAVYEILNNGGYSVQVSHHEQGPLCDAAFKYAQGQDWLVTDYFNITVNNSFSTYEIVSPITIRLTIPDDLISSGRKWRMVCVSRGGAIYSFADEDASDSTITFSPDRFYAYAMCYNDITETVTEVVPETEVVEETPVVQQPTNQLHSANESKTTASTIHSADTSVTTSTAEAVESNPKLKSDQSSAVERADGAKVALISM